ncbi:hypothetical protein CKM354_001077900 [Cercospora kikuchii]|uniref:DUF7730 domain-containing protein n=1 Tax=Cercospora kikuchii TaxID=84275 RepID=A0A9P3CNB2_9PEZI|nr:uncharacterized protein CKM354_001077900 [Cercospora kikuchii]GIZ47694.1 hypothetical protein CKM354_001077900 [Cercospora kikuchii]
MTTNSAEENVPESPLLALPAELRTRIYHYVLAGQNIHIGSFKIDGEDLDILDLDLDLDQVYEDFTGRLVDRDRHIRFIYTLCDVPHDDQEEYQRSCSPHVDDKGRHLNPVAPYLGRHETCFDHLSSFKRPLPQHKLHLDLLRTCRQVYEEAALMLYSDNTFSFRREQDALPFLAMALKKQQKRALESLVLCEEHVEYSSPYPSATQDDFSDMPKLRDVTIFIDNSRALFCSMGPRFPGPKTSVRAVLYSKASDGCPHDCRTLARELEEMWSTPKEVSDRAERYWNDNITATSAWCYDDWLSDKGWIKVVLRWLEEDPAIEPPNMALGDCKCPNKTPRPLTEQD